MKAAGDKGGAPPAEAPRAAGEVGATRVGFLAAGARPSDFLSSVGGYTLVKRIGQGSFAEVWQGLAPGGFPVAIKRILRPLEDQEAQREKEALERMKEIRHPFLLQTHSTFLVDNHLFVVMELADCTLRDRMKECQKAGKRQIPLPELLRYFHESAEVLDYMHGQRVLHRDIKPQNILILRSHAKVADFGLALLQQSQRALLTATGCGTPAYMAPEGLARQGRPAERPVQPGLRIRRAAPGPLAVSAARHRQPDDGPPQRRAGIAGAARGGASGAEAGAGQGSDAALRAGCQDFVLALENCAARSAATVHAVAAHARRRCELAQGGGPLRNLVAVREGVAPGRQADGADGRGAADRLERRPARLVPWLLAGALGLVLLGIAGWFATTERASFVLDAPVAQTLPAGAVKTLRVQIRRNHFEEPVGLTWRGLPADWQVPAVAIPGADNNSDVSLVVPPDAQAGPLKVTLQAAGAGDVQESVVELNVEAPAYKLPPGCARRRGQRSRSWMAGRTTTRST